MTLSGNVEDKYATVLRLKRDYPVHYTRMIQKHHPDIWGEIVEFMHSCNLQHVTSRPQMIFHWLNGITDIPVCPVKHVPLKFHSHKFEYRMFAGKGVFTPDFLKCRMQSHVSNPIAVKATLRRIELSAQQVKLTYNEARELLLKIIAELKINFDSVSYVGGIISQLMWKYPAVLNFIRTHESYTNIKKTAERLYLLYYNMEAPPTCKYTKLPCSFISISKGYKPYNRAGLSQYKREVREQRVSLSVGDQCYQKEIIADKINIFFEYLHEANKSKQNLKGSMRAYDALLVKSVLYHTRELPLKRFSERVWLLSHGDEESSITADIKSYRFTSFKTGFTKKFEFTNSSRGENEVNNFVQEITGRVTVKDRDVLDGKEIDIFIPELNLGIEYCGEYYHSYEFKGQYFHKNKAVMAESKGIKLVQIFESEWYLKQDIVRSIIRSKLHCLHNTIHGRKCELRCVDGATSSKFLIDNHLQGSIRAVHNMGAFYNNELVALMTFGRGMYKKSNSIELVRYCTRINTQITGIASRLLKFFIKKENYVGTIHTFADCRYSFGELYRNLGFEDNGWTEPGYFYFKPALPLYMKLHHRYNFCKHMQARKLDKFDAKLTEYENMCANGYLKIYDAGHRKFLLCCTA